MESFIVLRDSTSHANTSLPKIIYLIDNLHLKIVYNLKIYTISSFPHSHFSHFLHMSYDYEESFIVTAQEPHDELFWWEYFLHNFSPTVKYAYDSLPYDVRYPFPQPPISSLPTFASWYQLVEYLSLPPNLNEKVFRYIALACDNLAVVTAAQHPEVDLNYHQEKAIEASIITHSPALMSRDRRISQRYLLFLDNLYHYDRETKQAATLTLDIAALFNKYGFYDLTLKVEPKYVINIKI